MSESKGKGMFGLIVVLVLLLFAAFIFYSNYTGLEGRRQLEEKMQTIVRSGHEKTADDMIDDIYAAADDLKVDLKDGAVDLNITMDDYNNRVVDVKIKYTHKVDLLVTTFDMDFPIAEKLTLLSL